MAAPCKPLTRPLYAWEEQEARRVFGGQIDYSRVRLHECAAWPNMLYHLSLKLQRLPIDPQVHNAVTIANHCFFPAPLNQVLVGPEHAEFYKIGWLIHELTHVWQYQHLGLRYLFEALKIQLQQGAAGYQFGGEDGLRLRAQSGARLQDFNLEQQGDIARSYYEHLARGQDTAAWHHYVADLQAPDSPIQRA